MPLDPIRKYIRKRVKRPWRLPVPLSDGALAFIKPGEYGDDYYCPMGLIRGAIHRFPDAASGQFSPGFLCRHPEFTNKSVAEFGDKWDSFKDPKEAVKWVWGKRKRKNKK